MALHSVLLGEQREANFQHWRVDCFTSCDILVPSYNLCLLVKVKCHSPSYDYPKLKLNLFYSVSPTYPSVLYPLLRLVIVIIVTHQVVHARNLQLILSSFFYPTFPHPSGHQIPISSTF